MKIRMLAVLAALAVAVTLVALSVADEAKKASAAAAHEIVRSSDLNWTPLIMGSDMAVVSGDPNKEGEPFVIRIRQADGAKVPPTGIPRTNTSRSCRAPSWSAWAKPTMNPSYKL